MKQAFSLILRFVILVILYMVIGFVFGMYESFNFWRMLLMGSVFSGPMLGVSELLKIKKN